MSPICIGPRSHALLGSPLDSKISLSITFAPIVSWPFVTIVALALAWLVLGVYRPRLSGQPDKLRIALTTLRMAMWLVLLVAMLRPSLLWSEKDERPRVLYVAADASRSMTVADAAGGKTRRDALLDLVDDNSSLLAGDDLVQVRLFDFAADAAAVETLDDQPDGDWTDLGNTLETLTNQARGERVLGAVILSDGANRTPKRSNTVPADLARQFAEQTGASVFAVPFGASDLSAGGIDLAVETVSVDPLAFVKKTVPLQAQLRFSGFAGRTARVRVVLEDRTGLGDGEAGELKPLPMSRVATPMTEVTVDGNDIRLPIDLSFVAEEPGEFKLRVEVEAADGEAQLANNARETLITVRKNGLKVAYFDTARWEKRFLGKINKTARIQLDYVFVPDASSIDRILKARDWFAPNEYDVFLIGDLPPELFAADSEFAVGLLNRARAGAGLGLLAGTKLLTKRPPPFLEDVLPVTWRGREPRTDKDGFAFQPTTFGRASYVLRGVADVWEELPPFDRVFNVKPRNVAVSVMAETPDGDPLLVSAETGRGRTAVLTTADTWMWAMAGHADIHQRFWQQLLLWLGRKELDSDAPVWVKVEPRTADQGVPVEVSFGARDSEGEPRSDTKLSVTVQKPDGTELSLPSGSGEIVRALFEETDRPGDYWLTATSETPEGDTFEATSRLLINRRDAELDSPAADPAQLEQLTAASGGITIAPERFSEWLGDLLKASRESDVVKQTAVNIWDGWPLLAIFVSLLIVEWTIRRTRGLV